MTIKYFRNRPELLFADTGKIKIALFDSKNKLVIQDDIVAKEPIKNALPYGGMGRYDDDVDDSLLRLAGLKNFDTNQILEYIHFYNNHLLLHTYIIKFLLNHL